MTGTRLTTRVVRYGQSRASEAVAPACTRQGKRPGRLEGGGRRWISRAPPRFGAGLGHKMRRWKAMIVIWQLVSVIMTASFWEVCCLACSRASAGFFWAVGAELEYAYAPRTCTIGCLGHRRPECWERVPVDAQIDATDVLTFFSVA